MIDSLLRRFLRLGLCTFDWGARIIGRHHGYQTLRLELQGSLAEHSVLRSLGIWGSKRRDFLAVTSVLRWARDDDNVETIVLIIHKLDLGWARLQDLRRSIEAVRKSGKYVLAYLVECSTAEYYLASATDVIAIGPANHLAVTGIAAETTFFGALLDRVGVQAEVIQAGTYKSAGEPFSRRYSSTAHREMMNSLVEDLYGQVVEGIAAGRKLKQQTIREQIDHGIFLPVQAVAAGLIDYVGYDDEIPGWVAAGKRQVQEGYKDIDQTVRSRKDGVTGRGTPGTIDLASYIRRRGRTMHRVALRAPAIRVGIMMIEGTITLGETKSKSDGVYSTGSTTFVRDLRVLRDDQTVKGIVIRLSSPGGSAVASDLVWHEILLAKKKKPIIISMGDIAASGAYYIAAAGDVVFAEAGTVTGSIGVIGGKLVLKSLYEKIGLNKEQFRRGNRSGLFSDCEPFAEEDRRRMGSAIEHFYKTFVRNVATCRSLSYEAVHDSAQGRVWTGRQALARNLIDYVGGLDAAFDELKIRLGIWPDRQLSLVWYPRTLPSLRLPDLWGLVRRRSYAPSAPWLSRSDTVQAILPFSLHFL